MTSVTPLANNAKGVGVFAIVVAIVLAILQSFQDSGVLSGTANTSVGDFITAIGSYSTWATILVLAVIGFFLLRYMKSAN